MSQPYRVTYAPAAAKFIEKKAPNHMRGRLKAACESLGREPRPYGCEKMSGYDNRWRIREGDYRIVYEIYDKELHVHIIDTDHRKDIYR